MEPGLKQGSEGQPKGWIQAIFERTCNRLDRGGEGEWKVEDNSHVSDLNKWEDISDIC